ncbi:response regulator [Thermomonas sp.]|jgi:DNA-binding response OmpR family regulator|uniref:response regulator n=1 Tax=Thermomonas sp. TaxID=1971895 RepID=UPI001B4D3892|nr:response regulator [Thermomonas sp.]MBK6333860.1 response regulator [Thermomonas sp.]MBK6415592.1 response regulator [Thermomonas sp.]MBK6925673.1 response regulator [Thermomonas sp.]MBL0228352.1 response regulator [Thermomonas sp.]MBP7788838.1 response regulator [Thermomonas sp.]
MKQDLQHVVSDAPRVMVVDGSRLVRKLIGDTLLRDLPNAEVIGCGGLEEARAVLANGVVDLVTTALVLPDGDGLALARMVRETAGQAYVPVIVVSGNAQEALETRAFTEDITDYFDKGLGHGALAAFIRGYVQPAPIEGARVLYVEDSKVVAVATKRMLARQAMQVLHVPSVEEALEHLHKYRGRSDGDVGADLVLSDVYLKGALSGRDLLGQIRGAFGYGKRRLPMVMMTGDDNRDNQAALLREGANDLVLKPIEERLLVTKVLFQLRLAKLPEPGAVSR